MEDLERLIGRSIGGKVTTSVKMERTTHSKSNAQASTFSNVLLEANTQLCITIIWAALQRTILILESIGWDKNLYSVKIFLMIIVFYTDEESEEKWEQKCARSCLFL